MIIAQNDAFSTREILCKRNVQLPRLSELNMSLDSDKTFRNPCSHISVYPTFPSCCNTCISCWITICSSSSFRQLTLILPLTLTSFLYFPSEMAIPRLILANNCCGIIDCLRTISRDIWPWTNTWRNNFIQHVISAIW